MPQGAMAKPFKFIFQPFQTLTIRCTLFESLSVFFILDYALTLLGPFDLAKTTEDQKALNT
ncbi:hypothetical protein TUM3792_00680 [Shewanella sp. MBTL60-007]|nr:hypothetical protein TUM3792_00680 [Shewanella sp. MBTL60-007]